MSSSLFSYQENTKCESSFFADTCTRRVPIFYELWLGKSKEISNKNHSFIPLYLYLFGFQMAFIVAKNYTGALTIKSNSL
jgi:hypothetical protein